MPIENLDRLRVRQRGQVLGRHDPAEGAGPGVDGVVGAGDPPADRGAHPVGPDHEVGVLDAPVSELEHDGIRLLDDVHQLVQPRCRCSAPRAALRIFCTSARWMPEDGAPKRSTYQSGRSAPGEPRSGYRPASAGRSARSEWWTSLARSSARPSRANSRMALADSAIAAPISVSSEACSKTAGHHAPFPQRQCEGQASHARSDDGDAQPRYAHGSESRLLLLACVPPWRSWSSVEVIAGKSGPVR